MKRISGMFLLVILIGSIGMTACQTGSRKDTDETKELVEISVEEVLEEDPPAEEAELQPAVLTLTIPEGYTLARIGMVLEDMEVCTVDAFIDAAQNGDYLDFPLVAAQSVDQRRCFALEGYLFPDTYQIYSDESPTSIIRRILTNTEYRVDAEIRERILRSGYTVDEILTMASIIEKEAFGKEHMPGISSVLHNRLEINMPLQCDVTITYVEGAIKPFVPEDKRDYYSEYYNTYKCEALPAGAICNPSLDAVRAALSPAVTDYLFFVTDEDKNYYYAATWEEHLENVDRAGIVVPQSQGSGNEE